MNVITSITCTCHACPVQYEGKLEDGRMFYLRERHDYLTIEVSDEPTDDVQDAIQLYRPPLYGTDVDESPDLKDVVEHLFKAGFVFDQKLLTELKNKIADGIMYL